MNVILLFPILLPILAGVFLLVTKEWKSRGTMLIYIGSVLILTGALVVICLLGGERSLTAFWLTRDLPVYFKVDDLGRFFVSVVTIVWILAGFFSFEYMKHEEHEKRYFGFYLITYGVLVGLDFSGNLITMYMFYEFMTLVSMPMVLHSQTKEAVMAGCKYLFYSFFGAYLSLFGVYFLCKLGNGIAFTPGGVLDASVRNSHTTLLLVVTMLMLIGFGVKAGMFPLHAWLPTAHPVAPGPASAVLSGIIVKSGVLAIIRVVYYLVGPDLLRGSWVQMLWMMLALFTIFMGSMLAFREPVIKKRLAYSTVSQISYILFGLSLMETTAFTGALLHTAAHAFIKVALFLCAAAIIHQTGRTRVDGLIGIGKQMPVTLWCYTIVSLGLIGIPPTSGFISKWYLAVGSLKAQIPVFSLLGPVILLVSALLTAGYLLPVTMRGFFPGADYQYETLEKKEPGAWMLVPLLVLAALTAGIGIFPGTLTNMFGEIAGQLM